MHFSQKHAAPELLYMIMMFTCQYLSGERKLDGDVGPHHNVLQYQCPLAQDKLHEDE